MNRGLQIDPEQGPPSKTAQYKMCYNFVLTQGFLVILASVENSDRDGSNETTFDEKSCQNLKI